MNHNDTVLLAEQLVDAAKSWSSRRQREIAELHDLVATRAPHLAELMATLVTVTNEADTIKRVAEEHAREARTVRADIERFTGTLRQVTAERDRLVAEREPLIAELKELRVERDPDRLRIAIADAVERQLHDHVLAIATLRSQVAELESQLTECRASKRKLREALDRAKEGRR